MNATAQGQNFSTVDEPTLIHACMEEISKELEKYPEFADFLDDIDYHVCPRGELCEAMRRAPTSLLRLWLYSKFESRQDLAMVTGRSFV